MMNIMGRKSPVDTRKMMGDMMARTMETCFSAMDSRRRELMLTHCRSMIGQMEDRYLQTPVG